jgi:hypothetical protein
MIGLVLGMTGEITASHATDPFHSNALTKVAIIIFTLVFLVVLAVLVLLVQRVSQVKVGERRLLIVVAICSPFIATRLIYALISDFAEIDSFNSTYGNLTIYLCMAVIEEIIVVLICVAIGFTVPVVPKGGIPEEVPLYENMESADRTESANKPTTISAARTAPRKAKRRGGPITWLFRTVKDYFESKQNQEA